MHNKLLNLSLVIFMVVVSNNTFASSASRDIANFKLTSCLTESCINTFKKYKTFALRRHASAISALGEFYYVGYGTQKDIARALKKFKVAAKYGYTPAQFKAAQIHFNEPDYLDIEEGIKYLKKAARNKHSQAAYALGIIYSTNQITSLNYQQADKWLSVAQNLGSKKAQNYIEYLHLSDKLTATNYPNLVSQLKPLFNKKETSLITTTGTSIKENNVANMIAWPKDDMEVITVAPLTLEEAMLADIALMKNVSPDARPYGNAKSRIPTSKCDFCKVVTSEGFKRFAQLQSGKK